MLTTWKIWCQNAKKSAGTGLGHLEVVSDHSEPWWPTLSSDAYYHGMLQGDCYDKDRRRRFRLAIMEAAMKIPGLYNRSGENIVCHNTSVEHFGKTQSRWVSVPTR